MRHEIKRIEPLRLANILAVLYGIGGLVELILAVLVDCFEGVPLKFHMFGAGSPHVLRITDIVATPVVAAVAGWAGGIIFAFLYNAISSRIGGISIELAAVEAEASESPGAGPDA